MVRMNHGRPSVEPVDLAADDDVLADGQQLFEPRGLGMEEGQGHFSRVVMDVDAVRHGAAAARRGLVTVDAHRQRDDRSFGRERYARPAASIDQRMRCDEEQIDDPHVVGAVSAGDPGQHVGHLRADAGESRDRAEQGIENHRAHGATMRRSQPCWQG